ncbi:hypothetical protein pdam_00020578, partial [Pocillopora damicornis]
IGHERNSTESQYQLTYFEITGDPALLIGSHEGDNFIGLMNYEDVKTLSILHMTVLIAPYPQEKEQAKLSFSRILDRVVNRRKEIPLKKKKPKSKSETIKVPHHYIVTIAFRALNWTSRETYKISDINIVHGGWSSWGSWERCSLTCGGGSQSRVRCCTNPPPRWGGRWCHGLSSISQSCNTNHCPGESVYSVLNQQSFIIFIINFAGSRYQCLVDARLNESALYTHAICNINANIKFRSCKVSTICWY